LVEADHRGEFLVIDVNSGSYEMAPDDLTATQRSPPIRMLVFSACASGIQRPIAWAADLRR
jgi:hypothetical protein